MSADSQIKDILSKYGENMAQSTWRVQGQAVIYHKALERIAARAGIEFDPPVFLRTERDEAVLAVTGRLSCVFRDDPETGESHIVTPERSEWSIGEALVGVNYRVSGKQAAYVYAMAEKRAKDRVILKLIGLHGLLYSEDEADDFQSGRPPEAQRKGPANDTGPPTETLVENCYVDNQGAAGITFSSGRVSAYQARKDGRWEPLVDSLRACKTMEDLEKWTDENAGAFEELPTNWVEELRAGYRARAYEIKTGH